MAGAAAVRGGAVASGGSPSEMTSSVLGFEKSGPSRAAAEDVWARLLKSWRREDTPKGCNQLRGTGENLSCTCSLCKRT